MRSSGMDLHFGVHFLLTAVLLFLLCVQEGVLAARRTENRHPGNCRRGHNCHPDAVCYKTRRAYRCQCRQGFHGTGRICQDDDECSFQKGGCVHHCQNAPGNYTCRCMHGFQQDEDVHNCIDVDECLVNRGGCQHQCVNTIGSFECRCNPGFSLQADGRTCSVGGHCSRQLRCQHHCINTARGLVCACRAGYIASHNGRVCTPSCDVGNGGCQHTCTDTHDGPNCTCDAKYVLKSDNKTCVASCGVNNGGCDRRCESTVDGPRCSCPAGFILHSDQKTCLDVDECQNDNGGCSNGCVNSVGSYECICSKGYRIQNDQRTCEDIDECSLNKTCDHQCNNTIGSFRCVCNEGYDSYGTTHCADFDECSVNNGGCQHECVNLEGGFVCSCRENYKLHSNGKDCIEFSECIEPSAPAKAELRCTLQNDEKICALTCTPPAVFLLSNSTNALTTRCGPRTGFVWTHERRNRTWSSCSERIHAPGYKRRFIFFFYADHCGKKIVRRRTLRELQQQITPLIHDSGEESTDSSHMCHVRYVEGTCGTRSRRTRRVSHGNRPVVSAEFELQVNPRSPSSECNFGCARRLIGQQLRRTMKVIRRRMSDSRFLIRFENRSYEIIRRLFKTKKPEDLCNRGQVLLDEKCVSCSVGMYLDTRQRVCVPCEKGEYQDEEGQLACKPCSTGVPHTGIRGAKSSNECTSLCEPGTYSQNGMKPCIPCAVGTYQTEYGRMTCTPCGNGIATTREGATSFRDCAVTIRCQAGSFYSHRDRACQPCPRDSYQPEDGQDYCRRCPGDTVADFTGSTDSAQCKNRTCGEYMYEHGGYIFSPNWPGPYPANVECTWRIRPEKGRRILIVIPEIYLAADDQCGDRLVMRKSASQYSLSTYDRCESTDSPVAVTARSRKLWIQFKTDANNSAKGFTIPYVTYDEEYQGLIEEIVRDGRLYSSYQHQEVLKDRVLLASLLEVIAQPLNYYNYASDVHSILPASFLSFIRRKVTEFLDG